MKSLLGLGGTAAAAAAVVGSQLLSLLKPNGWDLSTKNNSPAKDIHTNTNNLAKLLLKNLACKGNVSLSPSGGEIPQAFADHFATATSLGGANISSVPVLQEFLETIYDPKEPPDQTAVLEQLLLKFAEDVEREFVLPHAKMLTSVLFGGAAGAVASGARSAMAKRFPPDIETIIKSSSNGLLLGAIGGTMSAVQDLAKELGLSPTAGVFLGALIAAIVETFTAGYPENQMWSNLFNKAPRLKTQLIMLGRNMLAYSFGSGTALAVQKAYPELDDKELLAIGVVCSAVAATITLPVQNAIFQSANGEPIDLAKAFRAITLKLAGLRMISLAVFIIANILAANAAGAWQQRSQKPINAGFAASAA